MTRWSDSKLFKYLNTNILSSLVSDKEKTCIVSGPDLLTIGELANENLVLKASPTSYAEMGYNYGKASYNASPPSSWWLKPDTDEELFEYEYIAPDGSVSSSKVAYAQMKGIRPVIRINLG